MLQYRKEYFNPVFRKAQILAALFVAKVTLFKCNAKVLHNTADILLAKPGITSLVFLL